MTSNEIEHIYITKKNYLKKLSIEIEDLEKRLSIFGGINKYKYMLKTLFDNYLKYNELEGQLLKLIKKYYKIDNFNVCDEIVEELNIMFHNIVLYNDNVLNSFKEAINNYDTGLINMPEKDFEILTKENILDYKNRLIKIKD